MPLDPDSCSDLQALDSALGYAQETLVRVVDEMHADRRTSKLCIDVLARWASRIADLRTRRIMIAPDTARTLRIASRK